jgi:hypothetical protein
VELSDSDKREVGQLDSNDCEIKKVRKITTK